MTHLLGGRGEFGVRNYEFGIAHSHLVACLQLWAGMGTPALRLELRFRGCESPFSHRGGALGRIGCYTGFRCKPGAEGVGQACTQAFVASFIIILALDFFLNILLNGMYNVLFGFRILLS